MSGAEAFVPTPLLLSDSARKHTIAERQVRLYSLGPALRNCDPRGPDLARRRAKKNTEPVRVWAVAEKSSPG